MSWLRLVHRRLAHEWKQSTILVVCLGIAIALPVTTRLLVRQYETDLRARAASTPLVAGAKGNRFDLALAALYFRNRELISTRFEVVDELNDPTLGRPVPLHIRFTAAGRFPIVGTEPDYFEARGLEAVRGHIPALMGQATLGATVAEELGLGPGDRLFSDQRELYDLSKPPALKMHVVGVLAPTGTADDEAVFVDIKSAWLLEGLAHGHMDPVTEMDESLIIGRTDDRIVVSEAMIEYNEVTPENISTFHFHGDMADYPITAVLFFPNDEKANTIVRSRIDHSANYQMIRPRDVVGELISYVFRIRVLIDGLAILLGLSTLALTALVLTISVRMRARERQTLHAIGCSPGMVARLFLAEIALLLTLAILTSGVLSFLAQLIAANALHRFIG